MMEVYIQEQDPINKLLESSDDDDDSDGDGDDDVDDGDDDLLEGNFLFKII